MNSELIRHTYLIASPVQLYIFFLGVRSTYAKENIPSHKEIRCSTEASQGAESSWREMARCPRLVARI